MDKDDPLFWEEFYEDTIADKQFHRAKESIRLIESNQIYGFRNPEVLFLTEEDFEFLKACGISTTGALLEA